MMRSCPQCDNAVDESLSMCPYCGHEFSQHVPPKKDVDEDKPKVAPPPPPINKSPSSTNFDAFDEEAQKMQEQENKTKKGHINKPRSINIPKPILITLVAVGVLVAFVSMISWSLSRKIDDVKNAKATSSQESEASESATDNKKGDTDSKKKSQKSESEQSQTSESEPKQAASDDMPDVEDLLGNEKPTDLIKDLKKNGDRYTGNDVELEELSVWSGNVLCVYRDETGEDKLLLTEKNVNKLEPYENTSAILDTDTNQVFENDDFILVTTASFYGTKSNYEYSGIMDVLMAKVPYNGYDYLPVYVQLAHNKINEIKKSSATSKAKHHSTAKLHDMKPDTCWIQNGRGRGEQIELDLDDNCDVRGIMLLNGDHSSENSFEKSGKISRIEVDFGRGVVAEKDLDTENIRLEFVSAGELVKTDHITITIIDVTGSGSPAISELFVY